MMKLLFNFLLIVFVFSPKIIFSQSDSVIYDGNNLMYNPRFSGVQVEATSLFFINELGGLIDFDLYTSQNRHYNLGVRLNVEYSHSQSISISGGGSEKSNLNYNFYLRHTIKGSVFWFSFLAGATVKKNLNTFKSETNFLPRAGFELRYNLTDYEIALLFKGAGSFLKSANYIGFGVSFGFHVL